jgi:hypothetical protein
MAGAAALSCLASSARIDLMITDSASAASV